MSAETLLLKDDYKAFANYYHNILKPAAQSRSQSSKAPTKFLTEGLHRLGKKACDQKAYKLLATIELTKGKDTPEQATAKVSEIYQNLFSGNNFANFWATLKRAHNVLRKLEENEYNIKIYLLDLALTAKSQIHVDMVLESIDSNEINKNARSICTLAIKHHSPGLLSQFLESIKMSKMKLGTKEEIIFSALETTDASIFEAMCSKPELLSVIRDSLPKIHELTIAADAGELLHWLLTNEGFAHYNPSVKELLRLSIENDSPDSAKVILQKFQGTQGLHAVLSGTESLANNQSIWQRAAESCNFQILEELANACPTDLQVKIMHHKDSLGLNILHYAAEHYDLSFIKLFTHMNGFLEALTHPSKAGITPLSMLAAHYRGDYEQLLHAVAEQIDTDCGLLDAIASQMQNQTDPEDDLEGSIADSAQGKSATSSFSDGSIFSNTDSRRDSLTKDLGYSSSPAQQRSTDATSKSTQPRKADIDKLLQDMERSFEDAQDTLPDSDRRESGTSDTSLGYSINSLPTDNLITCKSPFDGVFSEWWNN